MRQDRATVSGTVTFDDRPLTGGTISFISEEAGRLGASGMIDGQGHYRAPNVPVGSNMVSINTESIRAVNPPAYVAIPSRYHKAATSGLQADVQPGENRNVDFALEK